MQNSEKILAGALSALLLCALPSAAAPSGQHGIQGVRMALLQTTPVPDANDEDDSAGKATGAAMTLDGAFTAIRTQKFGDSRQPIRIIGHAVRDAAPADRPALAKKIAALLAPENSAEARKFACRQLRILGDPSTIGAIKPLLTEKEEISHFARYALEPMQAPEAGAALRDALGKTTGATQAGIVYSLGARRDSAAAPEILKLAKSGDTQIAVAAVTALGQIGARGGAAVLDGLRAARSKEAPVGPAAEEALLRIATEGPAASGTAIIKELLASADPAIRGGAARSLALAGDPAAVMAALTDDSVREPVLGALAQMPAPAAGQLAGQLGSFPAPARAAVIRVLASRPDALSLSGLRSAAMAGAAGDDPLLRTASMEALGAAGDAGAIPLLAEGASAGEKSDMAVAARSLERLRGAGIDDNMIASARAATGPKKLALLRALGARRTTSAMPLLGEIAAGNDSPARVAAFEAMGMVATEADMPALIRLLPGAAPGKETQAAEKAVVSAANRLADPAKRSAAVLAALPSADAAARPGLMRILGAIGGPEALGELRTGIASADPAIRDAAVRAMAGSTDEAAVPDLLVLAKDAPSETHRVLALRGLVRMAGSTDLKNNARLKILRDAMAVAPAAERTQVLAGLGSITSTDALKYTATFLDDPTIKEEAAAAALRIAKAVLGNSPKAASSGVKKTVQETIQKLQSAGASENLQKEADGILKSMS